MLSLLFLSAFGQEFEDSAVLQVSQVNRLGGNSDIDPPPTARSIREGDVWFSGQTMIYHGAIGYDSLNITASRDDPGFEWSFVASTTAASSSEKEAWMKHAQFNDEGILDWRRGPWACFNDGGVDEECTAQLQQLLTCSIAKPQWKRCPFPRAVSFLGGPDSWRFLDGALNLDQLTIGKVEPKTSYHEKKMVMNRNVRTSCFDKTKKQFVDSDNAPSKKIVFALDGDRTLVLEQLCQHKCWENSKKVFSPVFCKYRSILTGTKVWGLDGIECHTQDKLQDGACTTALRAFMNTGRHKKNRVATKFMKATEEFPLAEELEKYFEQVADGTIVVGTSAPEWVTLHESAWESILQDKVYVEIIYD